MQAQYPSETRGNNRISRKTAVIHRYGAPSVFQIETIDLPQIKPCQMLVKVYATSINPIEWKMCQERLKLVTGNKFPIILGFDVSGEVVKVGHQVTRLSQEI